MKLTRWGLVVLLCSIAVPGYGYQLRAVQGAPVDDESAGQEFIEVVLEREPGDVGACQVDGVVEAIDNPLPGLADALDGLDYVSQSFPFSLTIPVGVGQVSTRFTVPVLDDGLVEGTETFTANIPSFSSIEPATGGVCVMPVVLDPPGSIQILDDDMNAGIQFTIPATTTTEDAGTLLLTVSRMGNATGVVTVDFATADGTATQGSDYSSALGTLTWADGDTADRSIAVDILEDTSDEGDEDFTVTLSNVTGQGTLGANNPVTVTIGANDATRNLTGIATLTPNQRTLATWFDDACPRLDQAGGGTTPEQQDLDNICKSVRAVGTTDSQVASALDAINPDELLVASFNALRLTALQHGNLSQRMNALRSGATGIDLAGLNIEINGQQVAGSILDEFADRLLGGGASADEPWGKWGFFVNGRVSTGEKDASDFESGFDFDQYALTVGLDYRIRQNFIVGVAAGYGSVDSDYQSSDGGLDIDSWNGSVFLTYFKENTFYFDALATYGSNDYDSTRTIQFSTINGVTNRIAQGDADGDQYSAGFGSGFDFSNKAFTYGPHIGAYYFNVDVDSFSETGSGGLELAIGRQRAESLTANAGGHFSYAMSMKWGVLVPNARFDWVHEFKDNRETLSFRFIHDPFVADPNNPTPSIKIQTDRPDSDYFMWSVGVSAQFIYGVSGFVNYQSYTGYQDVTLDELSFGLRWEKTW